MCLAIPMRITSVDDTLATIVTAGLEQRCSIVLVPDARAGDYVLVHAGFAISLIDEAEANETLDLLREIGAFADEEEAEPDAGGASGDEGGEPREGDDGGA
jgi:hydrogenase expression/formation protein HypC